MTNQPADSYESRRYSTSLYARPTPAAAAEPVMQPTGWQWRRLGETEWRTGGMPANEPGMNYEMRGTFNAGPASPEAAGVPPGMVLVPREPTLAMMSALSGESNPALMDGFRADYRAMLAASGAPAAPDTSRMDCWQAREAGVPGPICEPCNTGNRDRCLYKRPSGASAGAPAEGEQQ